MAHVLIIEDNPENLELMSYLLRAFGHTTVSTDEGGRGVEMAGSERPDLIVCDVQLHGIDGYEVVQRLKGDPARRHIPIVAVTALAMSSDREKGLALGFDGYIAKPIDPELFVAQIEAFMPAEKRGVAPSSRDVAHVQNAASASARQETILAVDDSPTNRELIYQTLTPFGYQVHLAHSVPAALRMAATIELDLILSDLHMPGEDGFTLVRQVKADPQLSKLPFMFISSSVWGEQERNTAMELGVSRFLLRPIEPQALLDEVAACLARHRENSHGANPGR
jgi:two-component system cell cycle response regulator